MFLFSPGLQEVVTDDDGFETEIIEFRNAVGRLSLCANSGENMAERKFSIKQVAADGEKRRCSCNCTGRASLNCPAGGGRLYRGLACGDGGDGGVGDGGGDGGGDGDGDDGGDGGGDGGGIHSALYTVHCIFMTIHCALRRPS